MKNVQTTTTVVSQSGSNLAGGMLSFAAGIIVSFLSALLIYSVRQYWEKKKLQSALIEEIDKMKGVEDWATQVNKISQPPSRQIQSDDVPPAESIPTTVYEKSAIKLGLLQGPIDKFIGSDQISSAVNFYSRVLRAKGIIKQISSTDDVSNTAQEELYDLAEPLENHRQKIISEGKFIEVDNSDFGYSDSSE